MALIADPVVSPNWLLERRDDPHVRVLDGTWFFPHEARDADADFRRERIPGAGRFDIDRVADMASGLPHMLPSPLVFDAEVSALGLGAQDWVVVYETTPPRAAARAWWMFRAMGHDRVSVLDGGLAAWRAAGGPLESGPVGANRPHPVQNRLRAQLRTDLVRGRREVETALASGTAQILDARPAARFRGDAEEPRPGLRRGHMPGALNLPASELFDASGRMIAPEALTARLATAGASISRPTIATCGSGVTACLIALAFARLGRWDVAVYDGSFAEWGGPGGGTVVVGDQ